PINGKPEIFSLSDRSTLALNKGNIQKVIGNMSEGLVMTDESGPFVVNAKGITEKPTWSDFFNDSGITSIHKGPKDIIWAGTDGNGVLKLMPDNTSFNLVSTALVPEFEKGIVRAFQKVGKSSFFVGTKGKGLFKFTSGFDPLPEGPVEYKNYNEGNSRLNNSVYSLCMGREDILVIGSDDHGLAIFDLRKSQIVSWSQILDSHLYGDFSSVYAIYQDEDGFFWLGTNGYGLVRLKIERVGDNFKIGSFKVYKAQDGLSGGLSSNIIFSIEPRNDKELWIGTRLGGLNLFNRKTELFTVIKNNKKDATSLSNNDVLSLHLDKKKRLWVGTSFGLNLLESVENDTFQFKRFSDTDGLPDNTIHGIASGQNDDLWISTNMGVSRLNTLDHIFINFTQKDGLQNNEFSDGAYYQDTDNGYIYMGGIKGFNYFLPSKIHRSKHMPDLFIDEISGRNQSAPYFRNLVITPNSNAPPAITLNNDQNFFDVTLSALTYINNEKCQYAYQLKGFDQDWNMIGNQRTISFTNVPHGSYSLWVKWSNNDGVWGNSVRAMDITIRPYFWKSDWAVASYFVFFSLFLLFVFNYYKKQNSLRQNILFRKKEEEIHRNRLTFFTNIAHEFQTPLTLITGPSQRLSDAENIDVKHRKYIDMIRRNSSRLLLLTQQLLEFRKAEYDYLEVSVKQFDLVNLVEQIAELFDELALQNEIDYQLETQPQLYGWYDKDKIEKIIFNLLSNAFKYTPIQGSIKLSISKDKKYTAETLNITVTNSGKGIPKEKLNAIFERFIREKGVTSNTGAFRTGIGLAYVKKIVDVLNGQIKVDSKVGDLTTFTVLLPYGESAFQNHQFDDDSSHIFVSDHLRNIVEGTSDQEGKSVKNTPLEAFLNKKKVVLVVEDEKEVQMFIQELLREDYSILNASNGEEALRAIKKESPDLIISDVMMPVMDGVELCEKVKTNVNTHHIPFIMLTAKSSIIHRIEGLESGANSYIPKPFHPKHLQVRVQKLLEERESILKYFSTDIP
ncbi:MAG: response regulator, partial [Bacteroidota bacterium]